MCLLRERRLRDGPRAGLSRPLALDPDLGVDRPGGAGRAADRVADLPAPRPLLRALDARLPAGDALRLRVARLPGSHLADEARGLLDVHAVRRPAPVQDRQSVVWGKSVSVRVNHG